MQKRTEELETALGEQPRALRILEALERVNGAMRGRQCIDQLLSDVLDEMLEIFSCDRAWLLYPCDPTAPSWRVPMERTRKEWPGSLALGVEVPMDPSAEEAFRAALAQREPLVFDQTSGRPVPEDSARAFHIQSQMLVAIYPKTDEPWVLGIHHCAKPHNFSGEERALFRGISDRVADALGTLIIMRDLANSERRFRTLVEHAPEAIVVMNESGRFLDANDNAALLFGVEKSRLTESSFFDVSPREQPGGRQSSEAAKPHFARAFAGEQSQFEWTHQTSSGENLLCEVRLVQLADGRAPQVRGSIIDITQSRALQNELHHLKKMEATGELAGGIAHDFNNLLVVILGYCELIRDDPATPSQTAEQLELVRKSAQEAAKLTQQLLAFSRRADLEPTVVELNEVVRSASRLLRSIVPTSVQLSLSCASEPIRVRVDPHQLKQILVNLVSNARDALPHGGNIAIDLQSKELTAPDPLPIGLAPGSYATLVITDDGLGMDEATRLRAFEPFFTTKDRGRGTGLGLFTTYGVVTQSGGSIEVDSILGAGTTITVFLPLTTDEVVEQTTVSKANCGQGGSETILLVDDHAAVVQVAKEVLIERGYQVLVAADGEEALAVLNDDVHLDLLLTDIVMPGIDGVELASRAQKLRPGLRVLYSSGYTAGAIARLTALGEPALLLQKPYENRQLLEMVRKVLDDDPEAQA